MNIVHVDFLDLGLGFVSLTNGAVCEITGYFDTDGDAIDVEGLLEAQGDEDEAVLLDADLIGGVTFELPSGELFALTLNRFSGPVVH